MSRKGNFFTASSGFWEALVVGIDRYLPATTLSYLTSGKKETEDEAQQLAFIMHKPHACTLRVSVR